MVFRWQKNSRGGAQDLDRKRVLSVSLLKFLSCFPSFIFFISSLLKMALASLSLLFLSRYSLVVQKIQIDRVH